MGLKMYEHPSLKNIPKKTSFFSYVELNSTENYFSKFIFLFISLKRCMGLQKGGGGGLRGFKFCNDKTKVGGISFSVRVKICSFR